MYESCNPNLTWHLVSYDFIWISLVHSWPTTVANPKAGPQDTSSCKITAQCTFQCNQRAAEQITSGAIQVDNTGNRWKCLLLSGDNQESTLTCTKMPGRPRKPTKLSEDPFFLCADVWKRDTLTSWQANQRIYAEKDIYKCPTFVVLRNLTEKESQMV